MSGGIDLQWKEFIYQLSGYLSHPEQIGLEIIYAVLIFLIFVILQGGLVRLLYYLIRKLASNSPLAVLDHILDAFQAPIKHLVLIIGAYLAIDYLSFMTGGEIFIRHLFRSLVILCLFTGLYRCLDPMTLTQGRMQETYHFVEPLTGWMSRIIRFILVALGIVMIISEWGYDISGFIAGLGLGGLAVALAAQSVLADLVGGASLMMVKPYQIGDWVQTPSVDGTVEEIGFRRTVFRTASQDQVSVPNATLSSQPITNLSRKEKRQLKFELGIALTATDEVLACVEQIRHMLREHPDIDQDQVMVNVERLKEHSMDILVYSFTKPTGYADYLAVKEDVNLKILNILAEQKIQLTP